MPVDAIGYIAGICLIVMASMKTQRAMRICNITGNVLFVIYGALGGIWPVLVMNAVMLLIHLYRLYPLREAKSGT